MELNDEVRIVFDASFNNDYAGNLGENDVLTNLETLNRILKNTKLEKVDYLIKIVECHFIMCPYLAFEFFITNDLISKGMQELHNYLENLRLKNDSLYYDHYHYCLLRLQYQLRNKKFNLQQLNMIRNGVINLPDRAKSVRVRAIGYTDEDIRLDVVTKTVKVIDDKRLEIVKEKYSGELLTDDIKNLSEKLKQSDLRGDLANSVLKLKSNFYEKTDDFDLTASAQQIRNVMMDMIKDITKKVNSDQELVISNSSREDAEYREFLEKKGIISDKEKRLLDSFYSFISDEINHKSLTKKEYYRISLNIFSQIGYLIIEEYENYIKSK